jgi:hypothetical protein
MEIRCDRQEAVNLPQFHADPRVNRLIKYADWMGPYASIRRSHNLYAAVASVVTAGWHQHHSKGQSIGSADRMNGNRHLFGKATKVMAGQTRSRIGLRSVLGPTLARR